MVTHRRRAAALSLSIGIVTLTFAAACEKVPLLAPTGSVITLFASSTTVPTNGEIEIIATVIENGAPPPSGTNGTTTPTVGSGTPVHNGTLVSFAASIGVIEPREARTHNGEVRVRFRGNGQSGTARITAFSGGASGTLEDILVGAAAAERIQISASPQTLPPSGGTATIAARAENLAGSAVPGVPITFITTAGSLSASSAITDETGTARTILTSTREATVTANVAGKTAQVTVGLNPRTGVTLAGPTTSVSAGIPVTFTVGVSGTANIRDVTVDFGDGAQQSLGAISGSTTIQHTYAQADTYSVRAVATEASGFTEQVSTAITILPGQPPSVIITASNNNPSVGETIIFTATVQGATSTILRYEWDFGAGAVPTTLQTTGNRATATYTTTGTKIITVRVIQATGPSGEGQTAIVVRP
jgi:large repetitive protein